MRVLIRSFVEAIETQPNLPLEDTSQFFNAFGSNMTRFAGPDLLDYTMIFEISGGLYDSERLKIESAYHPCCGTLEVNAGLIGIYKRWQNKLDGCIQHKREGGGVRILREFVRDINSTFHQRNSNNYR